MNRILIVAGAMLLAGAAAAEDAPKDIPVPMTAADRSTWTQVEAAMDQCTGSALRGEVSICQKLAVFLRDQAAKIKAADAPPPK